MRTNLGFTLILVLALSLSGCALRGPCYGFGCPAGSSSAPQKVAQVPAPATGNSVAQQSSSAAPASSASSPASSSATNAPADGGQQQAAQADAQESKPNAFTRMLTALHLHSKS
jgi:predicted small lipoprotein YifL